MSSKDKILYLLKQGDRMSGNELAQIYGCTRSYISSLVKELIEDGVKISVTKKGYKLDDTADPILESKIREWLSTKIIGRKEIYILDEVDSTNNYAKELIKQGARDGTIIIADRQTGGRGRMGRKFESPKGAGLYFSVILRRKITMEQTQVITAAAAVAVAEAIENVCGAETKIKWVNDILINDKKVCGILTEGSVGFETRTLDAAVIGVGINCFRTREYISEDVKKIMTNIQIETGKIIDRNLLTSVLCFYLEKRLHELDKRTFIEEYKRRSMIVGKDVIVRTGEMVYDAIAVDIADDASLVIELNNGKRLTVNSGEARVMRND